MLLLCRLGIDAFNGGDAENLESGSGWVALGSSDLERSPVGFGPHGCHVYVRERMENLMVLGYVCGRGALDRAAYHLFFLFRYVFVCIDLWF